MPVSLAVSAGWGRRAEGTAYLSWAGGRSFCKQARRVSLPDWEQVSRDRPLASLPNDTKASGDVEVGIGVSQRRTPVGAAPATSRGARAAWGRALCQAWRQA